MHNYTGQQFGSYRLLALLGRGGFADVYLAQHTYLRIQVALKLFRARIDDEHMQSFLVQMRAIARLQHPPWTMHTVPGRSTEMSSRRICCWATTTNCC